MLLMQLQALQVKRNKCQILKMNDKNFKLSVYETESHCSNGARNGVISIGQWGVFNHEKGAICQSHLAAQKEGVVTAIIFSNHKTS